MTHDYGFFDECYKKFGSAEIYQNFVELFDFFPLSAVVGEKLFCLHGGLSKDTFNLDDIRNIDRFMEIPQDGNSFDYQESCVIWSGQIQAMILDLMKVKEAVDICSDKI